MVIDDFIISGIIHNNLLSLEYDLQHVFEHQIMIEASASKTQAQKNQLNDLMDKARVRLDSDRNVVSVSLFFLSIPKSLEDYADMLIENSSTIIELKTRDAIEEIMSLDESQEIIRDYITNWATEEIQKRIGGVL